MLYTDLEGILLVKQLRKAMDEVVRSKLMLQAIADDEVDKDSVDDLEHMAASLNGIIDSIVKATPREEPDGEADGAE